MYRLSDYYRWVRKPDGIHIKVKRTQGGCICHTESHKSGADLRLVARGRICDTCFAVACGRRIIFPED